MEATELRIGNYYQENGKIYTAEYYDIANLVRCETMEYVSDMQSIPITEELLLKFGLADEFIVKDCKIELYQHFADDSIWFFNIGNTFSVEIKFVHQLQNLYFALTNEELKLVNE